MSVKSHVEYIKSEIRWLPEYPSHWNLKRLKQVFKERDERSADGAETLLSVSAYTGVTPRSEIVDDGDFLSRAESLVGYKVCHPDDLVVNIMLAWNRGLGFAGQSGIVSPAYCVYRVVDGSSPAFLSFLVRSDQAIWYFKAFSSGVIDSRLRIYPDVFGGLYFALPPREEQDAIVSFLVRETGKIDTLVEEQQRLIELLKDKRQAVISQAVTKGLSPDVPMKDSGVEWLEKVPAHWEVKSLRYIIDAIGDVDHVMPQSVDKGVPYLMTGDLKDRVSEVSLEDCKQVSDSDYLKLCKKIKTSKGDVVMARYATIGTVMYVDLDLEILVSYSCVTLKPSQRRMSGMYLFQYMKSDAFRQGVEHRVNTNTQGNVGIGDLQTLKVAVPPLDEQASIAVFLETESLKIDSLIAESERAVSLLYERRSALISAAVTGKIDVRGLAPPPETVVA